MRLLTLRHGGVGWGAVMVWTITAVGTATQHGLLSPPSLRPGSLTEARDLSRLVSFAFLYCCIFCFHRPASPVQEGGDADVPRHWHVLKTPRPGTKDMDTVDMSIGRLATVWASLAPCHVHGPHATAPRFHTHKCVLIVVHDEHTLNLE